MLNCRSARDICLALSDRSMAALVRGVGTGGIAMVWLRLRWLLFSLCTRGCLTTAHLVGSRAAPSIAPAFAPASAPWLTSRAHLQSSSENFAPPQLTWRECSLLDSHTSSATSSSCNVHRAPRASAASQATVASPWPHPMQADQGARKGLLGRAFVRRLFIPPGSAESWPASAAV